MDKYCICVMGVMVFLPIIFLSLCHYIPEMYAKSHKNNIGVTLLFPPKTLSPTITRVYHTDIIIYECQACPKPVTSTASIAIQNQILTATTTMHVLLPKILFPLSQYRVGTNKLQIYILFYSTGRSSL